MMITPSISSAIEKLEGFTSFPDIDISACLHKLRELNQPGRINPIVIADIRETLHNILSEKPVVHTIVNNYEILGNAILHSLIALAATLPLNERDPHLQKAIQEDRRVVVSTGYQFDLQSLIDWHNTREWTEEEKADRVKELRNPITDEVLPDHDFLYIRVVALDRGIMFFQNVESDLAGISLLIPEQKLHPFTLELDFLSGNQAITFLEKTYSGNLESILSLKPNQFHCASTPAIRKLVETNTISIKKALLVPMKKRWLLQNSSILNVLKESNQPPSFLLSLKSIEVERLLNTVERPTLLIEFLQSQKWPISEIIALNDPHRDLLEVENVRQFLIDHQVSAKAFKNFQQYYSDCRCARPCKCFFKQEEFVADFKLIAEYRFLLEPIASTDALAEELISDIGNAFSAFEVFSREDDVVEKHLKAFAEKRVQLTSGLPFTINDSFDGLRGGGNPAYHAAEDLVDKMQKMQKMQQYLLHSSSKLPGLFQLIHRSLNDMRGLLGERSRAARKTMQTFKDTVTQIEQIKNSYKLGTEAAYAIYSNPERDSVLTTGKLPQSVLTSTPPLSEPALGELAGFEDRWEKSQASDNLVEDSKRLRL
jgi:hypothetical protein